MPVKPLLVDGQWRVVGKIAKNVAGNPVDGGGREIRVSVRQIRWGLPDAYRIVSDREGERFGCQG